MYVPQDADDDATKDDDDDDDEEYLQDDGEEEAEVEVIIAVALVHLLSSVPDISQSLQRLL